MLSTEQVFIGNVTFEPGCRNNWHIHHAKGGGGQILLVTAGKGWHPEFRGWQYRSGSEKLHAMIDNDLFFIDTVKKYPDDHMKKIAIAKQEYQGDARLELTAKVENMDEYETVIVALSL